MRSILTTILLGCSLFSVAQTFILTETVIPDQAYAVHSVYYENESVVGTSNIYVIKGTNDTIWLLGTGYGNGTTVGIVVDSTRSYSGALRDAREIYTVVTKYFGMKPLDVNLQVIQQWWQSLAWSSNDLTDQLKSFGFDVAFFTPTFPEPDLEESLPTMLVQTEQLLEIASSSLDKYDPFFAPFAIADFEPEVMAPANWPHEGVSRECCQALEVIHTPYGQWNIELDSLCKIGLIDTILDIKIGATNTCEPITGTLLPINGNVLARQFPLSILTTDSSESIYLYPNTLYTEAALIFPYVPISSTSAWTIIIKNKNGDAVVEDTTTTDRFVIKREGLTAELHTIEVWRDGALITTGQLKIR